MVESFVPLRRVATALSSLPPGTWRFERAAGELVRNGVNQHGRQGVEGSTPSTRADVGVFCEREDAGNPTIGRLFVGRPRDAPLVGGGSSVPPANSRVAVNGGPHAEDVETPTPSLADVGDAA